MNTVISSLDSPARREQLRHHARGHALGDLAADDHGARAKQTAPR